MRQENRFIDGREGCKNSRRKIAADYGVWVDSRCGFFAIRPLAIAGNRRGGGWFKLAFETIVCPSRVREIAIELECLVNRKWDSQ
jgi:hypothetical protein